jgi:dipeptidyl aminopeptidase/acylaminoacyl peptidase
LSPVAFAPRPGDARLIANCNETGEERPLIWDIAAGKRTDLSVVDLDGDIAAVDWSPDCLALLLVQLRAAEQRLYVHDITSGQHVRLRHGSGTYNQACFGPDGSVWSVWEDSMHPPQVVSLDARTGERRRTLLPAAAPPRCRPWKSVSFTSSDGQRVQGWLGLPEGDGPFPTILHLHGGPEFAMTELFYPSGQMWLDCGFAFLTVNYRGSTTFGREFLERIWGDVGYWEVEDMVAARSWLVSEQISEPTMIFVAGSSYGGYLTLQALGTMPMLWAGGMAVIAVADWVIAQEDTTATLRGLRTARFGGTPDEYPERYAKSSPLTYATDVKAPVLIIQGRNDTRTPPRSVAVYEETMKALGKDIHVHWFDAGHGSLVVEQTIEQHELMLDFARRVTKGLQH